MVNSKYPLQSHIIKKLFNLNGLLYICGKGSTIMNIIMVSYHKETSLFRHVYFTEAHFMDSCVLIDMIIETSVCSTFGRVAKLCHTKCK